MTTSDNMASTQNRHLMTYFILTFLVSWLLWLPSVLRTNFVPDLPEIVGIFGLFTPLVPMVIAFYLVSRVSGRSGFTQFVKRGISLDFNKLWLIPTIVIFPIVGVLTTIGLMLTDTMPEWSPVAPIAAVITFIVILLVGGGLEEFGWRGYALDPMQHRFGALNASLILGLIWGLWHLPLFFIDGTVQSNIPAWQFVLQITVTSLLYTWLYNSTNGSILVAILFHTIGNTTSALLPPYFATETGRWINFITLLIIAIVVWYLSLREK